MPPGGARPGAGRPRGRRDDPLVLIRSLTTQEARTINEDASVIAARTRLAAWEKLGARVANLDAYPVRDQVAILGLAMRYAGDHVARPTEPRGPDGQPDQPPGSRVMLERLEQLGRLLPALPAQTPTRTEIAPVPSDRQHDDVIDAELVWPSR